MNSIFIRHVRHKVNGEVDFPQEILIICIYIHRNYLHIWKTLALSEIFDLFL